jgi:hypothetical protein
MMGEVDVVGGCWMWGMPDLEDVDLGDAELEDA